MLHMAALEDQTVYFTFEDYQAINDTIIDYINSLLASGEVKRNFIRYFSRRIRS